MNYASDRPGDLNDSFELGDYTIVNAAVFYKRDNWDVAVNFKNLFNEDYIQGTPISRVRGIEAGDPFTVVASFSVRF